MLRVLGSICCIIALAFYLTSQRPGSEEDEFLKSATRIHNLKDLEGKVFPLIIAVSGIVASETNLIKCEDSDVFGVILEETVEEEYLKRNWKFSWVQYNVSMEPVIKEVPWYLDDGTGRVNVSGAYNATGFVLTFGSDVFEEAEPSSFFRRIFDNLRGFKMLGVRRIDRVLEIGTKLTVVGEAIKDDIGNVEIRKPEDGFFYVTPIPFDQLISDPGEWSRCFEIVSIGLAILGVLLISTNGIVYSIEKAIEMSETRRQRQRERQLERERERERLRQEQERERLRQESERERLRQERERERLRQERKRERERLQQESERERLRQERLQQESERERLRQEKLQQEREREWLRQEWKRERLRQESERGRLRQERELEILRLEREREQERFRQELERERLLQNRIVDEASKRPEPVTRDLEAQDENSDDCCVICLEKKCNVVFLPCTHLCCCKTCSSQVSICPLCRAPIDQVMNIFRH